MRYPKIRVNISIILAKAGIHRRDGWIPAFARKTKVGLLLVMGLIGIFGPAVYVQAASLGFSGPTRVEVGQTFQLTLRLVDPKDVDTIRANGQYPSAQLSLEYIAPVGVLNNRSPGNSIDTVRGIFTFGAFGLDGTANTTAPAVTFTFRALKAGRAHIELLSSSRVLSAGQDQGTGFGAFDLTVTERTTTTTPPAPSVPSSPPAVPLPVAPPATKLPVLQPGVDQPPESVSDAIAVWSSTHPDPDRWYALNKVIVQWMIEDSLHTKAVRIGFDQIPEGLAEIVVDRSGTWAFYPTRDGIWYVHLRASIQDGGEMRRDIRVRVDREPPRSFEPFLDQVVEGGVVRDVIRFGTVDETSEVEYYDIVVNGRTVTSTAANLVFIDTLPGLPGRVTVQAVDSAGNARTGSVAILLPEKQLVPMAASRWQQHLNRLLPVGLTAILFLLVGFFLRSRWFFNKK